MEKYHSELLRLMVKIACIFGIPAFVGFFGGLFLDRFFGTERRYIVMLLGASFILSWVLFWRFYVRMKRKNVDGGGAVAPESGTLRYDEPGIWQSKGRK